MTSEERNEKKRVEKRFEKARILLGDALTHCYDDKSHELDLLLRHKINVLVRRIARMKSTLSGYEE